jgi:hypothetical protein
LKLGTMRCGWGNENMNTGKQKRVSRCTDKRWLCYSKGLDSRQFLLWRIKATKDISSTYTMTHQSHL